MLAIASITALCFGYLNVEKVYAEFQIIRVAVPATHVNVNVHSHPRPHATACRRIYVTGFEAIRGVGHGTVYVIDSESNTVLGSPIYVGQFPIGIGYSPYSKDMYVVNNKDGTVSVIDSLRNTVVGSPINVGHNPVHVAGDYPDSYEMYVTNYGDGTVSVINPSSNPVVGSPINVGGNPVGIAYCSGP